MGEFYYKVIVIGQRLRAGTDPEGKERGRDSPNLLPDLKVIRCRTEEEGEVQAACQVASLCY